MEIDEDNSQPTQGAIPEEMPSYGTKRYSKTYDATVECCKNMQEMFEEYKKYSLLRKQDDMTTNNPVGSEAYIISTNWLQAYSSFIMFDSFKRDFTEDQVKARMMDDHFEAKHPGKIMNEVELCEADTDNVNLYGTGTAKGMDSDYIDIYIDQKKNTPTDFQCINKDLWTFLFERYGGQIIKRLYYKGSSYGSTNVDSKLKAVKVKILNSEHIYKEIALKSMCKEWWTQVARTGTIKDVKHRIYDHIKAAGFSSVQIDDLRLWYL